MKINFQIKEYIYGAKINLENYLFQYASLGNIDYVISYATLAKLPNKPKHCHQRRLQTIVMSQVERNLLLRKDDIVMCRTFDELITIIKNEAVKGFGELAIYDTALRIGAYLKLYPEKVYLHAGTLKGARVIGLNVKNKSLTMQQVPNYLKQLKPYEIEDFLCIYKDKFNMKSIKVTKRNRIVKRARYKK